MQKLARFERRNIGRLQEQIGARTHHKRKRTLAVGVVFHYHGGGTVVRIAVHKVGVDRFVFQRFSQKFAERITAQRPINALLPPRRLMPTATFAGAPPGHFSKRSPSSGIKSTTASPSTQTRFFIFIPFFKFQINWLSIK